jgi:hypothetical protein
LVHYRFRSISFISSQRVIAAGKSQPRQPTTLSATPVLPSGLTMIRLNDFLFNFGFFYLGGAFVGDFQKWHLQDSF